MAGSIRPPVTCPATAPDARGPLVPLPLVGDLLRVLGDGAGGDDGDDPAQLHDVADGRLEGGGDGMSVGAGAQLDPQREGIVVALAADDDPGPAHGFHARDDLVDLAGTGGRAAP